MWNVECVRCGESITADSPSEIARDVDGNPRHEECPYADNPEYPLSFTVQVEQSDARVTDVIQTTFPHLQPELQEKPLRDIVPTRLRNVGRVKLRYRAVSTDADNPTVWNSEVELTHVNGLRIAPSIPRLVYECDGCGTRVDGKVAYLISGPSPFVHTSCSQRNAKFRPVEFSHLDKSTPKVVREDVLAEYTDKANE